LKSVDLFFCLVAVVVHECGDGSLEGGELLELVVGERLVGVQRFPRSEPRAVNGIFGVGNDSNARKICFVKLHIAELRGQLKNRFVVGILPIKVFFELVDEWG